MSTAAIKLKKSSTVGKIPLVGDITYGELALNYADGRLYYKNSSNAIKNFIDSDLVVAKIAAASGVTANDGTLTLAVSGTGLSGSASFTANQAGNSTFTVTSNATSANTSSAIVARDASGNFSAGTITATLTGNASTATTLTTPAMIQGVDIPTATDLNTYTTSGFYHQNTNANAAAGTNYPVGLAGMLEVMADGLMVYQRYTLYSSGIIYTRSYYNGTWYSWRRNVDTGSAGIVTSDMILDDTIVNADINSAAAIADTKLATISTAGKVSNSATTATSANTLSAIVARDASGNFTAGTITAALTGNASTATTLQTARTIAISGDVTGTATSFNGSANITISAGITAGSIVSADFSSATSLIIYNSVGTAVKTVYSPGS